MIKTVMPRELMFDPTVPGWFRPLTRQEIQERRLPKPEPIDVFRNKAEEKLWRIAELQDADGYLRLALDAVRHFFFCDKADDNMFSKGNLYRCRYVDTFDAGHYIHNEVEGWLCERESWCRLLETEPLHSCFDELIRPLRDFISTLFQKIDEGVQL